MVESDCFYMCNHVYYIKLYIRIHCNLFHIDAIACMLWAYVAEIFNAGVCKCYGTLQHNLTATQYAPPVPGPFL